MSVQMITVQSKDDDMRLDRWFKQHYPNLRHGELEKLLRKGNIRVDGGRVKANHRLVEGNIIRVPPMGDGGKKPPQKPIRNLSAEDKAFIRELVIYEDHHVLAINKPFGLAVQGGQGITRHIDGLLEAFGKGEDKPRLVHRLDKDTGGVLVLARTRKAAALLSEAFKRHEIEKEYWALCAGLPDQLQGTIDMPIAKKMVRIKEMDQERVVPSSDEDAKKAITDYQVVEMAAGKASFVALRPITGRTHQLRVHTAAVGHPIIGDGKYGGEKARLEGISKNMHLFCRAMRVPNPAGGQPLYLKADLTGHMKKSWEFFSFSKNSELIWPEK